MIENNGVEKNYFMLFFKDLFIYWWGGTEGENFK